MIVCHWCDRRPALAYLALPDPSRGRPRRKPRIHRLFACLKCRPMLEKITQKGYWMPPEQDQP